MEDEPTNAAADVTRRQVVLLNDEEFVRCSLLSSVTPDFVRFDHRRLTRHPMTDGEGWRATLITIADLLGEWPTYRLREVLAVRGERLVAIHTVTGIVDVAEIEFVAIIRFDEAVERVEVMHYFDPEEVDLAIAELDRLHDELTHGD